MAFCNNCGTQVADYITVCPSCGGAIYNNGAYQQPGMNYQQPNMNYQQPYQQPYPQYQQPYYGKRVDPNDAPSGGFAALGFFFPLIGLILYLVWKDESPLKAKSCGKGALAGFLVSVGLSILFTILYAVFIAYMITDYSYYYY